MNVPNIGVSSDAERASQANETGGGPVLEFSGDSTPYIDYQSIEVLLSLQNPRSGAASELPFYVLGQVKELLFKLLHAELLLVRDALDGDRARVSGTGRIDRTAFGVGQGEWAATDAIAAGVDIAFSFSATRPAS